MPLYALIDPNSRVCQLSAATFPVAAPMVWTPDVSAVVPSPEYGWAATEKGGAWTFTAPAEPVQTLAQQAAKASVAGLTIASTGPTLTMVATLFPTDAATQTKIGAVVTTINATGAFPDGVETFPMKDASCSDNPWHPFTVAQYKAVAGAISNYVATLNLIADGNPLNATALPPSNVSLTV
jgi:hypothetical protein